MTSSLNGSMRRAVSYARVSTDPQRERGASIPTQFKGNRAYAERLGADVVTELQDSCSGTIPVAERPEGGRALYELIARRAMDLVIVYTNDRTARDDYAIEMLILHRDLDRAGIELHFADTGKVSDDPYGRIVEFARAAGAADERKKILERTQRGRIEKLDSGRWPGNHEPPYGYRREGEKATSRLVIYEPEAAVVRRIFDDYAHRLKPLDAIAQALTAEGATPPVRRERYARARATRGRRDPKYAQVRYAWYRGTLRAIIKKRIYIGEIAYMSHTTHDPALAIVDRTTFEAAQKRLRRNFELALRNQRYEYLLTGFLHCHRGHGMGGRTKNIPSKQQRFQYYVCWRVHVVPRIEPCDQASARVADADRAAWQWARGLLNDTQRLIAGIDRYLAQRETHVQAQREQLDRLSQEIASLERRLELLARDLADLEGESGREALKANINTLSHNLDGKKRQQAALQLELGRVVPDVVRRETVLQTAAQLMEYLSEGPATYERKRRYLDRIGFAAKMEERDRRQGLLCSSSEFAMEEWVPLDGQDA